MIFRVLAILLFIVVIAGSLWLGGQEGEQRSTTTVADASGELGYSARHATLIETGEDGLPLYTLQSELIRQHPDDGVEFEPVQLTFRDSDGQTWKGRANHGQLTTDTGKVDLSGDVHVDGLLPGSTEPADLATEKLMVDTRQDIITTDQPVTVRSPGRLLQSIGLVATLKEHHLVLESNVHGSFTP